ncbi:integral membrane sensor signal transduction histidine kinase : Histidine kinase OS=Geobacter metallireducens (strain GS-15 / ATCC 53774 / DSM 7210) GN=Gmet_1027 PE=4 SV=1: HisKA: HATPase_c [Gemmata massiliana]|uniref:histidine kinase n=1 Tax=Gemmata massiliana TaxID=1210884 RepID=A0A6P2D8Z2_9BACT|nr:HAMP domain-containing sensor histidine kinase [Gemmata massiliana]VTR97327.1 integral membrane sensor signal transduction histidine kinase : Histidine kinase OS=Geobacter metallireducens (strain GS-15 / ATCC 53774 / DSM 7210) GN=Gmet_1027 PE=4 SV=1: HisKA: HATPase_c [Gemmata massiliana]
MRSIRRSLLAYLLVLLALALGAVGVLVDGFAIDAIRAREKSESDNIEHAFKVRHQEAKAKFDADLMTESKALAKEAHYKLSLLLGQTEPLRRLSPSEQVAVQIGGAVLGHNLEFRRPPGGGPGGPGPRPEPQPQPPLRASEDEARQYSLRLGLLRNVPGPNLWSHLAPAAATEPHLRGNDSRRAYPYWVEFDGPRFVVRVQEAFRKVFTDDEHSFPYQFQFTLVATYPNRVRNVAVIRSEGIHEDLAVDPAFLEPTEELEPKLEDITDPGLGACRRIVTGTWANGRPNVFWLVLPTPPTPTTPSRFLIQPWRGADMGLRVIVQTIRPYSDLDARLAADQQTRDEQLERVRAETRIELAQFRGRLILIGAGTFAALVLGGWFFVARGLAPLQMLSDAVSQVSEKDFRLPVVAHELGRELAPIHARITQTLTLLQRAFEREKQAVADISHELRTPIASLLATIDVALRKPRTPEQYRTTLEECRLISKQLGQLVERIMTLASLDAGNDHTHITRTDAGELAIGCAAVIRPLAAANNLSVAVNTDEVAVDTDPGKLREVLMNLLHNAVEYNSPNGTIDLAVRREGEAVVFEVRDTGIGMTPEVRERIFERFYRADSSRHATGVHAGLGLAIVKEYVARLNGSIEVESEPGAGTTFRVTLSTPASEPAPSAITRMKAPRDVVPSGS